ncbi:hypothetical protein GGI15_000941 [Coemansia interrupta]|uniref:PHD-type domain-containing protein n=1 Tax=Coemansia interrupta TaxID=1126814 RepID=A0A9W8LNE6_9FUNG|nr:hypothetical protein GGI15_000941 [Coemansia interrupta]
MTRAIARAPAQTDTASVGNRSSYGSASGLEDSLSSGFTNGSGVGLGHSDLLPRKRSLDNVENIPPPPFGIDNLGPGPKSAAIIEKPAVSLLDITAQHLSQNQRKQRRTMMTNSSPGGSHRVAANPRRVTQIPDSSLLRSLPLPHLNSLENIAQSKPSQEQGQHQPQQRLSSQSTLSGHHARPMRHTIAGTSISSCNNSGGARLGRLPKRNLKPLDFSSLYRQSSHDSLLGSSASSSTDGATASTGPTQTPGDTPTATSKPASYHTSSNPGHSAGHAIPAGMCGVSLPVSPIQSSPIAAPSLDALGVPALSPTLAPSLSTKVASAASSFGSGSQATSAQPTPPNTGSRRKSAFSGLLASAYERASSRRSSQRNLCFGSSPGVEEDESLRECDPVLGPRCPVIGDPRGLFDQQRTGRDCLQSERSVISETKPTQIKPTVHQSQTKVGQVATQQRPRGRLSGRQPGRKAVRAGSASSAAGSTGKRPISECKYCGKQYKYHSKLLSHEQHCSSRLEALLYSADENEQHVIHCLCGPRHDRPFGNRDELPMVQCDNCLAWLHIDCVDIDEKNLPEEYFCPRCVTPSASQHVLSTPKRRAPLNNSIMSPESDRLAKLLADVPDRSSDTEDEPMHLRLKATKPKKRGRAKNTDALSSEDTMSISDAVEVVRFHRQGSATKRSLSPVAPRLAQSEANVSPVHTPSRRRGVRKGASSKQQTVHTDTLSSDFLSMPLPETIFSSKPVCAGSSLSIAPGLCSQQPSMEDLSRYLSESQPQWSLAQLSNMLGSAGAGTGVVPGAADMIGAGSSFYLDQALADLGLDFGSAMAAGDTTLVGGVHDTQLSELVDLPVDNEFSALLDSIASGDPGVDSEFSGILNDDTLPDLDSTMSISAPLGAAGSRVFSSRPSGVAQDFDHNSSSTISLMHDNAAVHNLPPPARPPPGMPGVLRSRNNTAGGPSRNARPGTNQQTPQQQPFNSQSGSSAANSDGLANLGQVSAHPVSSLSTSMALGIPSNPPSATGIDALDVSQLLASTASAHLLDWQVDGDALLEGLIDFDA